MLERLRKLWRNLDHADCLTDFIIQTKIMYKCMDEWTSDIKFLGVRKSTHNGQYYVRFRYKESGQYEVEFNDLLHERYDFYWRKTRYGRPIQNIVSKKGIVG